MGRNIEIKARIDSIEAVLPRALALGDGPAEVLDQDDSFFIVPWGRLKLRQFADGSAELIHYLRADTPEARASDYLRVPVVAPQLLREALARSCGWLGRVRKRRWLVRVGATRIHLDRVEGLGDHLELEVVLAAGQGDAEGSRMAEELMLQLDLGAAQRIAVAYLDLLPPAARPG
jgi:adenylate cyclase class IV